MDAGGGSDPILDGAGEPYDTGLVPMTLLQGIVGARREGVSGTAPVTYFEGRHVVAARLLGALSITTSAENASKLLRAIADVATPSPSTSQCENGPRSLNYEAR